MTGFLETIIQPDKDELDKMDRREVGRAANILQVGEFQLLQLAYREWHQEDLPESQIDRLFNEYMIDNIVPHWARHYARQIIRLDQAGRIAGNDLRFHRYDNDYGPKAPPHGIKKFAIAAGIVMFIFGSGVAGAIMTTGRSATQFPPYVSEKDLQATPDETTQDAPTPSTKITGGERGSGP
ncbi:MAG: hypothetical protein RIB80_03795 [Rhodospirillales bacterium]